MEKQDKELIRDLYLSLENEGEFYPRLTGIYRGAEKNLKKGQMDKKKFIGALQKSIADYCLNGPRHFSYNRKFYPLIPKETREAVAEEFLKYFNGEIESGNSWLGEKK